MKEIHVVSGYANTGSGSLTFPEDFDTPGFYEKKADAVAHVKRLNDENGVAENGDWLEGHEEDEDYDGMIYFVDTLKNLGKV